MAEIGSAYVTILPSAQGFGSKLNSGIAPGVNKAGLAAGAGLGKSLLKGFLVIGAVTQITQFVGDAFAEAREAQKVSALVDNAIKQTGGVAKVSAEQINRLADAFSRKTGIDDEQIASSAAMLLTFKNVRREGEGLNNIFARATRSAADLAASGFGSMESTSKQLGKALNDPLKGLTALGRAGVTFTAGQTERIKGFVAENNILAAQKIILKEVESQTGGAAEATATWADKSRVALDNIKEQIGTALLPAGDAFGKLFTTKIAPAISGFITNLQTGQGSAGRFGTFIRENVIPVARDLFHWYAEVVAPAIRGALVDALEQGRKAFDIIRKAVAQNKPELTQLFNGFKRLAEFFYTRVVPAVYAIASRALPILAKAISGAIAFASDMVRHYNKVKDTIDAVRSVVGAAIDKFQAFKADVGAAVKAAKEAITRYINQALGPIRNLISLLQTAIDKFNELRGKSGGVKGGRGTMADVGRQSGRSFGDGFARGLESMVGRTEAATEKLIDKLKAKLDGLKSEFDGIKSAVAGAFTGNLFESETASGFIANLTDTKGTLEKLKAAFQTLLGWGLKPQFLSQLFASGNAGLILDLAAGGQAQAVSAGSLFGQVGALSNTLGAQIAQADIGPKIDKVAEEIRQLRKELRDHPERIGDKINGAARGGHRRGKVAAA